MRARDWARAAKPLQTVLAGFRPMRFGFVQEEQWLAKCIYADSSGFKAERFFVHAFVMPLFIPTDHLNLTYGFRVGSYWEQVDDGLTGAVKEALPRLDAIATLSGLADLANDWTVNVRDAEVQLCISVLQTDETTFAGMEKVLTQWRPQQDWETEVLERSKAVMATVETGGFEKAKHELAGRRQQVLRVLQ